jgi:hypothetical protein
MAAVAFSLQGFAGLAVSKPKNAVRAGPATSSTPAKVSFGLGGRGASARGAVRMSSRRGASLVVRAEGEEAGDAPAAAAPAADEKRKPTTYADFGDDDEEVRRCSRRDGWKCAWRARGAGRCDARGVPSVVHALAERAPMSRDVALCALRRRARFPASHDATVLDPNPNLSLTL